MQIRIYTYSLGATPCEYSCLHEWYSAVGSSHLARNCVIAEINERIIKERIEKKRFEGERQKRIRIKYSISYAISLFLFSASRRALENCLARNISRKYLARGNWLRERRRMSQFTIACLPSTPRPSWFAAKRSFIRKMIDASFHFRFLEQNFTRIRGKNLGENLRFLNNERK